MPQVYVSGVVGATAARVWSLVAPFDGLASWHPAFASSVITNGVPANLVGAERLLTLRDGGEIRERLLGFPSTSGPASTRSCARPCRSATTWRPSGSRR